MIKLLLHEITPTKGRVVVNDRDVTALRSWRISGFRRQIGCVFQDFRLLPNRTAYENVAFALEVIGKSQGVARRVVPEVLELVGLGGKEHRYPHELSGGEQQRVAVARAFVNRPLILLADEPTGNLDPDTSIEIMRSLAMLGSGLVMYKQIQNMRDYYFGKIEVSIFLKNDYTDAQQQAIQSQLANDPLVKQPVIFETKDQAYQKFKVQFKDAPDLVKATKPDSLPASFRVKLKNPKQFNEIAGEYRGKDGVDDVLDQQQLLSKVFGVLGAAQNVALFVAILMAFAALLLVGNTIQVAAYSRRREVAV